MGKISLQNRIFGTVKSFSLRGVLLTKDDYQTLAESRDLDEFITRLKNTRYLEQASEVQKPYSAQGIELTLKTDLINYHAKMNKIAVNSDLMSKDFLRYMVWNIKFILKSKALLKSEEEIRARLNLRAEEIIGKRDIIVRALIAKDLDEAIAALASTEFGKNSQEAVRLYREKKDIQVFDTFLDHTFYSKLYNAIKETDKESKHIVLRELDAYNILSILRGKFWNLKEEQIEELIVGRSTALSIDTMQKMISASNIQEALSILANTSYNNIIPQQITDDISAILAIESAINALSLKDYLATYLQPFKEANILAAIRLKSIEIKNLIAIATGVEQRIPAESIIQRLIILKE